MDSGLMSPAVARGDIDIITAFATDGRIEAIDRVLLDDNMRLVPPRQDVLEESEVEQVPNQRSGTIDDATMSEMSFQVDEEGREPSDVARAILGEEGIIERDSHRRR